MKLLILILTFTAFPMIHSDTAFPILIVRENEFGRYDTLHDSARTVFDFDNKFVVDGRNYPKPKYNVITGGN
jgi:hypothetical protein